MSEVDRRRPSVEVGLAAAPAAPTAAAVHPPSEVQTCSAMRARLETPFAASPFHRVRGRVRWYVREKGITSRPGARDRRDRRRPGPRARRAPTVAAAVAASSETRGRSCGNARVAHRRVASRVRRSTYLSRAPAAARARALPSQPLRHRRAAAWPFQRFSTTHVTNLSACTHPCAPPHSIAPSLRRHVLSISGGDAAIAGLPRQAAQHNRGDQTATSSRSRMRCTQPAICAEVARSAFRR